MGLMERDRYDEDYDVATSRTRTWDPGVLLRVVGAIAAGVMTVIGLIAVAKISWGDNGFDAAPVNVAGMVFTPEVAVATAAAGVIALIAGAVYDRASKLIVGALLVCAGIVILVTNPTNNLDWTFDDGQGWLAIGVGVTLIVVAVLMQMIWTTGHRVRHGGAVPS
jgi:hypothetical protein